MRVYIRTEFRFFPLCNSCLKNSRVAKLIFVHTETHDNILQENIIDIVAFLVVRKRRRHISRWIVTGSIGAFCGFEILCFRRFVRRRFVSLSRYLALLCFSVVLSLFYLVLKIRFKFSSQNYIGVKYYNNIIRGFRVRN